MRGDNSMGTRKQVKDLKIGDCLEVYHGSVGGWLFAGRRKDDNCVGIIFNISEGNFNSCSVRCVHGRVDKMFDSRHDSIKRNTFVTLSDSNEADLLFMGN
jgi:hypothetical protein